MNYSTCLSAFLLLFVFSCGQKNDSDKKNDSTVSENIVSADTISQAPALANKAILLWDGGIISMPSTKEGKWVATYQFGNTLTLTGKSEENKDDKRTYKEVTGPDGKTGWINEYLLLPNATIGAAYTSVILYKNPDVMSVSTDKIKAGDLLAVSAEDKGGFRQVYGKEKKIKGFINSLDKISSAPLDLEVAIFYQKALAQKTSEDQLRELQAILDDPSNASSKFYALVRSKVDELNPETGDYDAPVPADTVSR
jgi:hypothetical protein